MRLAVAILFVIGAPAIAGEVADRTELVARIEDAVHAVASSLDAQKLDDASGHVREIREMLTRLVALKGTDGRSADVLAHYPAYATAADTAIEKLRDLDQKIHRMDGVVARCTKDDTALRELVKRRTARPDSDPARDLDALTNKADEIAATWGPVLTVLAKVDRAIASDAAATKLALTDGYWMAVTASVAAVARTEAAAWTAQYEPVTVACAPLGLGQQDPDLVPVLEALRSKIAVSHTATLQITRDYNAWLASVRELRDLALEGRKAMHGAVCQATDGEIASRVGAVATTWGRDLGERTTTATAEGARLLRAKPPRAIGDGLKLATAIVASIARDESAGRANPRLVSTLAAIAVRRDHSLVASKCAIAATDPASCIKIADRVCTIVEPAPDQDGAKAAGFSRAQRALDALLAWHARDKASLFARVPALKRCEIAARSTLDLATDVVSYPACSVVTPADFGEPLGDVPANAGE